MNFNEYWKLLWTIKKDSDVEQYYDELLRPFFKEAIKDMKNVKVIPTYDTRYRGKNREKYECITGSFDKLVWPDYIFVPIIYSHNTPVFPYIKIEFKKPNIGQKGDRLLYYPIYKSSRSFQNEISSELSTSPLILTDGITWLFLKEQSDINKIKSEQDIERICFVDKKENYYSGNYVVLFQDANERFNILKKMICTFIEESSYYKKQANTTQDTHIL